MSESTFLLRAETRLKNGELIRLREMLGKSQQEFADEIGVTRHTYCGYENLRCFPSLATRLKIAVMAGRGIDEIFPPELRKFADDKRPRLLIREARIDRSNLLPRAYQAMLELHAPTEASQEDRFASAEILARIVEFLRSIPDTQATAVMMRLGIGPYRHGHTFSEIGKKFGVSGTRAQQFFDSGLAKILKYCPAVADLAASRGLNLKDAPMSVRNP
jgi:DNA-binding XRE family transcriptional regulator